MDEVFYYLTLSSAVSIALIFFGMAYCLVQGSIPAFKAFGLKFLFSYDWDPVLLKFGALGAIEGTLLTSFIALVIAAPLSFGITIFTFKVAPYWMKYYLRIAIDILAGIPSIIYGMWGLFALTPLVSTYIQPWLYKMTHNLPLIGQIFAGPEIGIGIFTASLVLAVMVIPFISSIMHDVFALVPDLLQESSYALGATTWETIWQVILPYGRKGFIGAIMLGFGRALGETMAITFVIGNAHTLTKSLFQPASSITSTLSNEFTEATGALYTAVLIELAFWLFIVTGLVIFLSKRLLLMLENK